MENKTIKQNANNIMWVEYWIQKAHPSFEDYELFAERYDDYRWICEIKLPLIEKSVKSISEKEVNAMLNASEKAAKLIDEYMKEHPELKIINRFKGKRWEIVSDETVKKAIKKLAKINGTSKNLYIQVLDQSFFDDNMTVKEILEEVNDKIEKEDHTTQCTVCYDKDGDSVIVVGYTLPSSEKGELN